MAPLVMVLRERIVKAYSNEEGRYTIIAKRFDVSPDTVGSSFAKCSSWERANRNCIGGVANQLSMEKKEELRRHLEEHPDATVLERREALESDFASDLLARLEPHRECVLETQTVDSRVASTKLVPDRSCDKGSVTSNHRR